MSKIGRLIYWLGWPLFKLRFDGNVRTRCIVRDDRELLLVRSTIGHQEWSLPGGGIKKGESEEDAVIREVFEETGLLLDEVKRIGEVSQNRDAINMTMAIFTAEANKHNVKKQIGEILEAGWFLVSDLPNPLSPTVLKALMLSEEK